MINHSSIKSLLLLGLIILGFGCSPEANMLEPTEMEIQEGDSIYFLALGDSYTIGQGVKVPERWPNQLSEKLKENGIKIRETRIIARTGWTTSALISAIGGSDLSDMGENNLVSLLIGVNNQFRNQPFETFEIEFTSLLNRAIQLSKDVEKVFVVSIPDYGVTPFGSANSEKIARELDAYNAYMKEKCERADIPFIDITEISRELGGASTALASDRLHPSGLQYEKWVEEILPVVLEMLAE